MNITIDIGNSLIKTSLFQDNKIVSTHVVSDISKLWELIVANNNDDNNIFWCSVKSFGADLYKKINLDLINNRHFVFDYQTKTPILNKYSTPSTLGLDRLAAVVGANTIFPKSNLLIIDAGTCITYDFLSDAGEYLGGSISLGFNMRYEALHHYTAKLPLLTGLQNTNLIGNSTTLAIQSGVINGLLAEIVQIKNQYTQQFSDLKCIICGGDAEFITQELPVENFYLEKNLVHIGLHTLLLESIA